MLDFTDPLWTGLSGGYKIVYDPRPALSRLAAGDRSSWDELWNELHHQGDIGEAAYAAIPHIVRIYQAGKVIDWNAYAMVALIEEARRDPRNPSLPDWARPSYGRAVQDMVMQGLAEFVEAERGELVDSILAVLAFAKNRVTIGKIAGSFAESEREEMLKAYFA